MLVCTYGLYITINASCFKLIFQFGGKKFFWNFSVPLYFFTLVCMTAITLKTVNTATIANKIVTCVVIILKIKSFYLF